MDSRKQVRNLKPWPKGVSGNPGGRPKRTTLTDALRELLAAQVPGDPEGRTHSDAIAEVLVKRALKGDVQAAREIADRTEGRPRQALAIEAADSSGGPGTRLAELLERAQQRAREASTRNNEGVRKRPTG